MTPNLSQLVRGITPEMVKRHSVQAASPAPKPKTKRIIHADLAGLPKAEYQRRYQARRRQQSGSKAKHAAYCAKWRAARREREEVLL